MDNELVKIEDGKVLVSSRDVANNFEKKHAEVLYSIEGRVSVDKNTGETKVKNNGILMSGKSQLLEMFIKRKYLDNRGREQTEYLMTRDGFSLLVMGFTGVKALEWKLKYIDAFNKMEEELKSQNEKSLPTTYKEALMQLLEQVEKNEQLEEERKVLLPKADYHDVVLNKEGLLTTTMIAKDLGLTSAAKLNQIMYLNEIIYKGNNGVWYPYAEYDWLIKEEYADYKSYENEKSKPCLKWTEKGRKWIVENFQTWKSNVT